MSKSKLLSWLFSRLAIGIVFSSTLQNEYFGPFLTNPSLNFLDPWSAWVGNNGRLDAFPYGLVMFLFFLPSILLFKVFAEFSIIFDFTYLISLTLLGAEFFIFKLLRIFDLKSPKVWSWMVLVSPLPIYISFIHGQIDVVPTLLMLFSCVSLLKNSWFIAGLSFGFAIDAKFSFALAIPFLLLFFISKQSRWRKGSIFFRGSLPGLALLVFPMILSKGFQTMVLDTPEVLKTLDARVDIGISTLFLVPIAFLIIYLVFWNLNQVSTSVLVSFIGAAYLVIALTQTSSIGWFYWGFPLILFALRDASFRTHMLFIFWQACVCLFFVFKEGSISTRYFNELNFESTPDGYFIGLIFTLNVVLGVVILWKILNEALKVGDIYSLASRPLSVNIAGDSGVGKDTLANEVARLFGEQEVALLLGDDYHLHERGESSWLSTTHLSIEANDLETMGRDFQKLLKREPVFVKHYDHTVGKFTLPRKIKSSQLVIVNGLHANLIPGNNLADLKIYLSMEEELRIKLKVLRDTTERKQVDENGIRAAISARIPHFQKFVEPQSGVADLHLHVKEISSEPLVIGVVASSKDSGFLFEFRDVFNAISQIPATLIRNDGEILLEFDTSLFKGVDANVIFNHFVNSSEQLFPIKPLFADGSSGLMSLLAVLALVRRRINRV